MCENERCCDGVELLFYVNHDKKELADDWVYCNICYPDNDCKIIPQIQFGDWTEISISEYNTLKQNGYRAIDFS